MKTKAKRAVLKDMGIKVPRANKDVDDLYREVIKRTPETQNVVKLVQKEVYTYLGRGEDSPHVINFMEMQRFVRGEPTEVKNEKVLEKVKNNPSFVKGEVDKNVMFEIDDKAREEAKQQRLSDRQLQAEAERTVRGKN